MRISNYRQVAKPVTAAVDPEIALRAIWNKKYNAREYFKNFPVSSITSFIQRTVRKVTNKQTPADDMLYLVKALRNGFTTGTGPLIEHIQRDSPKGYADAITDLLVEYHEDEEPTYPRKTWKASVDMYKRALYLAWADSFQKAVDDFAAKKAGKPTGTPHTPSPKVKPGQVKPPIQPKDEIGAIVLNRKNQKMVICGKRYQQGRGYRVEYKGVPLAEINAESLSNGIWIWKLAPGNKKLVDQAVGWADKQTLQKAKGLLYAFENKVSTIKSERAEKGRSKLTELQIQEGDVIRVRYRDIGWRKEICIGVNPQNGRIALKRRHSGYKKRRFIDPTNAELVEKGPGRFMPTNSLYAKHHLDYVATLVEDAPPPGVRDPFYDMLRKLIKFNR